MAKKEEGMIRKARIVALFTEDEKARYIDMCKNLDPPEDFSRHMYESSMGELRYYEANKI